jgi:RNA polymerase sigma factor for flagellar operon FliA
MSVPGTYRADVPPPPRPDTRALWASYVETRDPGVRERLFAEYIGLVHRAARDLGRRPTADLEHDDLVSAGTIGLVQALETFDPGRGLAFSTHAMPRIRGAILDEIRGLDWLPRSARERRRDALRVSESLRRTLGREPTEDEAAELMPGGLAAWRRARAELRDPAFVPIDGDVRSHGDGESGGPRLADALPDAGAVDMMTELVAAEERAALAEAFASLPERDRLILSLSFYERLPLREIAALLLVTESRVSQLRTRALQRLRERFEPLRDAA